MLVHTHGLPVSPPRAVVIGAGGFVGSSIAAGLRHAGVAVLAITRTDVDLLADAASDALAPLLRPTDSVVFVSAVAPAKTSAQLMTNLRMAESAIGALKVSPPAHLLYISSDAVYADDANPVNEASSVAPTTMHGMMHAARELMFRTEVKAPFAALRPTLIYGAADPHSGYGPNRFRRQAASGQPILLFGEGEERRDHVAVEDVARLAALIVQHRSVGALNAVTGVSTSFRDIAHMVASNFGSSAQVVSQPRSGPPPHLMHRFFDIANVYKAFPDFHFERLQDGLARVHRELHAAGAPGERM